MARHPHWQIADSASAERVYRRAGVPNLIEGYAAPNDILTRLSPWLSLWFVLNIAVIVFEANAWRRAVAVVASLALVLVVNGLNQHRNGRRWFSRPERVSWVYVGLFFLVPIVVSVGFSDRTLSAAVSGAVGDAVLLAIILALTAFGVGSMMKWAIRQIGVHASRILEVILKTLPLMLVTVLFFFFTAETWQLLHHLPRARFLGGLAAFTTFGSMLLIASIARNSADLATFESWSEVCKLTQETGCDLSDIDTDRLDGRPVVPPLPRRVKINLGLVLFFSQATQVLIVFIIVSLALTGIGLLLVRPGTMAAWIGEPPHYLFDSIGDRDVVFEVITTEVLKVAMFIGAFAALQFALQVASEGSASTAVLEGTQRNVRRVLAVRMMRERLGLAGEPTALESSGDQ